MPNNILITPGSASITFSGSAANTIRLQVEPSGAIAFYGASGSLFSITDNLSGSLMSVDDISGLPILEVFSDDKVVMGSFNRNTLIVTGSQVMMGTTTPTDFLTISGTTDITGAVAIQGVVSASNFTASVGSVGYFGTASWASSASFVSSAFAAGWAQTSQTASFVSGAYTAQWALQGQSAFSASFVSGAYTAQWAKIADTASFVSGAYTAQWAKVADTASFVSGAYTSKWAPIADTASFVSGAYTSQWSLNAQNVTSASYAQTASAADSFYVSGVISIGAAKDTTAGLYIGGSNLTTTSQKGALIYPVFNSAGTSTIKSLGLRLSTVAAGFSVSDGYNLQIIAPVLNNTAVTNVFGIQIGNMGSAKVTNAYGIQIDAQSGAGTTNVGFSNSGITRLVGDVTSSIISSSVLGVGFVGTASFASSASTALWTPSSSFVSGAYTAQWAKVTDTASFVSGAYTSQWSLTAQSVNTASFVSRSYVSDWALVGQTSYTASFVSGAYTAQWAKVTDTASFVSGAYAAQWAKVTDTASFVSGAYTAKWAASVDTASFVSGAYTAKWALSAQSAVGNAGTATALATARLINGVSFDGTANIATTSSWTTMTSIPGGLVSASAQINTGSFSGSFSASVPNNGITGSVTGALLGTSSWANSASFVSASYVAGWAQLAQTASFVSGAYTAQWALTAQNVTSASYAATASAGNQFFATIYKAPGGSAAAPSYTFMEDPAMGFYRITSNRMGFIPGNSQLADEHEVLVGGNDVRRMRFYGAANKANGWPQIAHNDNLGYGVMFGSSADVAGVYLYGNNASVLQIGDAASVGIGTSASLTPDGDATRNLGTSTKRYLTGSMANVAASAGDNVTVGNVRFGGLAQVNGAAIGFNLFTPTGVAQYYCIISGKDSTDGNAPSNAFIDVVVFVSANPIVPVVISSTTTVGTPGARTYSNNGGALKIAVATGATWYIDVARIRFAN